MISYNASHKPIIQFILLKQWGGQCAFKIFPNITIVSLIPFAQKCGLLLYITKLKENPSNINVLVLISFLGGAFKTMPIKMIHFFKTLSFGMHPQLTNMDCHQWWYSRVFTVRISLKTRLIRNSILRTTQHCLEF